MSKSKSRKRRDNSSIANRRLPLSFSRPLLSPFPLIEIEDRRQWHPEGEYAPARSFSRSRHRLTLPRQRRQITRKSSLQKVFYSQVPSVVSFYEPLKVLICVRRSIRKEVLHALNKTGRRGQKRPRYNFYSSISCRS